MATNFSSLKKARSLDFQKLASEARKGTTRTTDERFWSLTMDPKTKIGKATIRFLPAPPNEEVPWVRIFSHTFQHNGSWFFGNCPTTLATPDSPRACPVCEDNTAHWKTGDEGDKDIARSRKRQTKFISNILVIDDPVHPEHNGKVMLFKYGNAIHQMLIDLLEAEDESERINPFDFWEGANFQFKSQNKKGFVNYDKSSFDEPSPVLDGNEKAMEELWQSEYPLLLFINESQFQSYETMAKNFERVISGNPKRSRSLQDESDEEVVREHVRAKAPQMDDDDTDEDVVEEVKPTPPLRQSPKSAKSTKPATKKEPDPDPAAEDEDEIAAFFKNL